VGASFVEMLPNFESTGEKSVELSTVKCTAPPPPVLHQYAGREKRRVQRAQAYSVFTKSSPPPPSLGLGQ